jgi:tetratricopeptide (TPR) repeat protein
VLYDELGSSYRRLCQYPQAIEYYKRSLVVFEEMMDGPGAAIEHANLGNVYMHQGKFDFAIDAFEKARGAFLKG